MDICASLVYSHFCQPGWFRWHSWRLQQYKSNYQRFGWSLICILQGYLLLLKRIAESWWLALLYLSVHFLIFISSFLIALFSSTLKGTESLCINTLLQNPDKSALCLSRQKRSGWAGHTQRQFPHSSQCSGDLQLRNASNDSLLWPRSRNGVLPGSPKTKSKGRWCP